MTHLIGHRYSESALNRQLTEGFRSKAPGSATPTKSDRGSRSPSQLRPTRRESPQSPKFISLARYLEGFSDRTQWPILWPDIHKGKAPRPYPKMPALAPRCGGLRRPHLQPARLSRPAKQGDFVPASPESSPRVVTTPRSQTPDPLPPSPVWGRPRAESAPSPSSPSPMSSSSPSSEQAALSSTDVLSSARSLPVSDAQDLDDSPTVRFHDVPSPSVLNGHPDAAAAGTESAKRSSWATAWDRVCANKGVQRALAVGKLAADCMDLLAASLASYITGQAVIDAVAKNFKSDWHRLVHGEPPKRAQAEQANHGPDDRRAADIQLVDGLSNARAKLKKIDEVNVRKAKTLRRAVWGRGLTFAACLVSIGMAGAMAAVNPALGGVMIVLSVYAARQAYANWRLARENLHEFNTGGSPSPMGSNALGHVLREQYAQDATLKLTPSEAHLRAANRSTVVGVVNIAANLATGGMAMAASSVTPAAMSAGRYVARAVGFVAAPVSESIDAYATEKAAASLVKKHAFDESCCQQWQEFFLKSPDRVQDYEAALTRYQAGRGAASVGAKRLTLKVSRGKKLDLEPLVRWTRTTRCFDDLQAWMAFDKAEVHRPQWAERLFADLQASEKASTRSRLLTGAGAVTNFTTATVSVAL